MRTLLLLVAAIVATPAAAQVSYPPGDTSALQSAVAAATAKADAASAAAASAQASIPQPATALPPMESVAGFVGTPGTYRPADTPPIRISRTDVFGVAGSSGMLTVTWTNPMPTGYGSYPVFFAPIGVANSAPVKWKVITSTNTGFTAQCYQEMSSLALTLSALTAGGVNGLVLPVSTFCPAGTQTYALQLPSAK